MPKLIILGVMVLSFNAQAVTRQQLIEQYGRPVRTQKDMTDADDDGMVRKPSKPSYKAEEGDKCKSDFDCALGQFCRKANSNYVGVCVEKEN